MKKFFLFTNLFIFCLVMGFSAQAKDVGGIIDKDTVWTKADSPIIVKDNVTVVAGVTLTIEPYVTVKFDKGKALTINGMLVAKGTASEKIIFTSNGAQQAGYWGFISFSDTSVDATFDSNGNYTGGCIIQFADIQWGGSGKSVLTIDRSSPFIADSFVANNSNYGISITNGSPVIKNCQIKNHSNSGIYYSGDKSTKLTIQDCAISGNSADSTTGGKGSGIRASGTLIIQNSTINGNSAYWYGGGVYLYSGTLTIQSSTISGNYAMEAGGGIYLYSGTLTIQSSTISGNKGDFGCGGIYLYSGTFATIQNSTISGNSDLFDGGGGIFSGGTLTIQNSTISGNSVGVEGGGIFSGGTLTIQNSTISGNFADCRGGGILASGIVTIENNTFTDNSIYYEFPSVNTHGGAISVGGTVIIRNNVFKNNSAPYGGAIWAYDSTVTIQGNTIVGNTASESFGGVVRLQDSKAGSVVGGTSCQDTNLIKDNNGDAVYIEGSLAFNYNDIYNNTGVELINGSSATINASNCYWGTADEAVIKAEIWDGLDDPKLGLVTYKPFLTEPCKPDDTTPPSAVTNLSIYSVKSDSVTLNWTAPGDDGDIGTAAQYDIRYSTLEITDANWGDATQCQGEPAPKPAGSLEAFTVTDLSPNTVYYFAMKTADEVPNWSALSNVPSCKTAAKTGDVSGNGEITAYDASLVLQYVVGLIGLSAEQRQAADVTGDGNVTALDAALILQHSVGLIIKFPVEITSTAAPALSVKSEDGFTNVNHEKEALMEEISRLEATELNSEQRKVLEQLKRLVFKQLIPKRTVLLQNHPNPFNPETWIPFKLAEGGKATITIYDVHGRLVRMLSLGYVPDGVYQTKTKAAYWDGRNESGELAASGVYFYNLQSGKFSATRKMVISK